MNIIFYSPNFHPMVGGLENVVKDLAVELTCQGHFVRILTLAPSKEIDTFSFSIIRLPTFWKVVEHIKWGDIYIQVNISLKGIIPYLFVRKPFVVYHQNLYPKYAWHGRLKWFVSRQATINIGCSSFIADHFFDCHVLGNPYDDSTFKHVGGRERSKDIVFLGRLVSDKGCEVILYALHILRQLTGLTPILTIVGDGPEKQRLIGLVHELALVQQVRFAGVYQGHSLAALLNEHQIMVVPSVYEEPFGIVALEGIACGCFVIGSKTGGLTEAIGPCGITFPMGDANALATVIAKALGEPIWRATHLQYVTLHLRKHTRRAVGQQFIKTIKEKL